jgi:hypothetical protein
MAEGRSLQLAIETSDDFLPNFREIIERGKKKTKAYRRNTSEADDLKKREGKVISDNDDVEIIANLEKFRKILSDQSFEPLLLELAVVHDRRLANTPRSGMLVPADDDEEQYFTSYMASYLGRLNNSKSLLISAWNNTIDELLRHEKSGRYSLMAYKETYQEAFLTEQFNWAVSNRRRANFPTEPRRQEQAETWSEKTRKIVESRNLVMGKLERVHAALEKMFWTSAVTSEASTSYEKSSTASNGYAKSRNVTDKQLEDYLLTVDLNCRPTVYTNTYSFSLIPQETETKGQDVKSAVSYLASGLICSLDEGFQGDENNNYSGSIQDFLMNCHLLVLPFRRPVAFSPETKIGQESWGDSPGGCLFAIFKPRLGSMVTGNQLEDLATRLSLALARAALREAYIAAELEKQKEDMMRLVTHQFPSIIKEFSYAARVALDTLNQPQPNLELAKNRLEHSIDVSEALRKYADFAIHAYKVRAKAERPKAFEHSITLDRLYETICLLANQLWQRINENAQKDYLNIILSSFDSADDKKNVRLNHHSDYLLYVLRELLRNSFKHGADQTSPQIEIKVHNNSSKEVLLVISNKLKDQVQKSVPPKSRIGLSSLEDATFAYGLSDPVFSVNIEERRFVATIAIAKMPTLNRQA